MYNTWITSIFVRSYYNFAPFALIQPAHTHLCLQLIPFTVVHRVRHAATISTIPHHLRKVRRGYQMAAIERKNIAATIDYATSGSRAFTWFFLSVCGLLEYQINGLNLNLGQPFRRCEFSVSVTVDFQFQHRQNFSTFCNRLLQSIAIYYCLIIIVILLLFYQAVNSAQERTFNKAVSAVNAEGA